MNRSKRTPSNIQTAKNIYGAVQGVEKVEQHFHFHQDEQAIFNKLFRPVADVFAARISRNFLFEFDGDKTNYFELLSQNLRNLFFSIWNRQLTVGKINRIGIMGREGSGKTFNALLLGLKLVEENYNVYYCKDVRSSELTSSFLHQLNTIFDSSDVFIIDECHSDLIKLEDLVTEISRTDYRNSEPLYIFLTRPFGDKVTSSEVFGRNTPIIIMYDHLLNFEYLLSLFLKKIGKEKALDSFLKSLKKNDLSHLFFKYRNMAFWNEVLLAIESTKNLSLLETDFYKRGHAFLRKTEPFLLNAEVHSALASLLPFFARGISIRQDYVLNTLNIPLDILNDLEKKDVIHLVEQDWVSKPHTQDTALFYSALIHPTKAKILIHILKKYYDLYISENASVKSYIQTFPESLYYILGPIYDPSELSALYEDDELQTVTKEYIKNRHLGKKLDRLINKFALLEGHVKDQLFDQEIINVLADKINSQEPYIVNKLYALRALYRLDKNKVYEIFLLLKPDVLIQTFLNNPEDTGITSFSKLMEVFKNIYYIPEIEEKKQEVREFVIKILDACADEFVTRVEEKHDYFTQLESLA